MSSVAVSARGVSKRYRLGQLHEGGYQLLSEKLIPRRRRPPTERVAGTSEFLALDDVDFEVAYGESYGIIGHNGAGKSTLLKVLSRVTPPTSGEIDLYGRVGALLEVGTGFHPELTGRENIYLNGAVLGMRRAEIDRRFDEIVEFAEVERFIDTPVKRYSSGMFLRLAFAVAAHLEPEILIVDEVLAVGDIAFQEKCLGRMEEVTGEGRTVLFVSHNLAAVSRLCDRAMLLSRGRKVADGPVDDVVADYLRTVRRDDVIDLADRADRHGNGRMRFTRIWYETDGERIDRPASGQTFDVVLAYETADGAPLRNVNLSLTILTPFGQTMLHLYSQTQGAVVRDLPPTGVVRCRLPRCPLPAGQYTVTAWADIAGEPLDWIQRAAELGVVDGDFFGSGRTQLTSHQAVLVDFAWLVGDEEPVGPLRGTAGGTVG